MLRRYLTAGLVLLTAVTLHSLDARLASDVGEEAAAPSSPAQSGLKVVMNPATGEIVGRPTADQLGRLGRGRAPAERRSAAELERFDLPHGARGVVLEGWADHATRVERDASGALRTVCVLGDRHGEAQ